MEIKFLNPFLEDHPQIHAAILAKLEDREPPKFCTYECTEIEGRIATVKNGKGATMKIKFLRKVYGVTHSLSGYGYISYETEWFNNIEQAINRQEETPEEYMFLSTSPIITEGWQ